MELKWSTVELFDRILISEGLLYWLVMFICKTWSISLSPFDFDWSVVSVVQSPA